MSLLSTLLPAAAILVLNNSKLRAKFRRNGGRVKCEKNPEGDIPQEDFDYSIRTPIRMPKAFNDFSRFGSLPDYRKVVVFTKQTPIPSEWPYECVLHQVNSNNPVEDRGVVSILNINKDFKHADNGEEACPAKWLLAAVIDGHSGWQTSDYVARVLSRKVEGCISSIPSLSITAEQLKSSITKCFLALDEEIRSKIEPAFDLGHHTVMKPGATTCCTLVTPTKIAVANIGDSRAYLCRNGIPIALTAIHNAGDPVEAQKLRDAHPNEPDVVWIKQKKPQDQPSPPTRDVMDPNPHFILRLLTNLCIGDFRVPREGPPPAYTKARLQLTRSFGDFYLKEKKFAADWEHGKSIVNVPHSYPYLSVIPDLTVIDRVEEEDEFLVVASDGVWDELLPQEVVDIGRRELRKGNCLATAAKKIQEAVTAQAAYRVYMSESEMFDLSAKERRKKYDDLTIALVNFRRPKLNLNSSIV